MAKRVRMTAQERREQLVGVARSLFAERGFEATSIEEIADRAGVSKPVVYQHFGGKEGVYAVVVDREVRRLTTSIAAAFDAGDPRAVAESAAESFLAYIEEHEEGFRVLIRDAPIGMTGGSFASVISDVATRAEQQLIGGFGERGFDNDTAPMYALMLVGAVALVGEWWLEHRDYPREQVAAHVVNLLWNGLRGLQPDPVARTAARRARAARAAGRQDAEVTSIGAAPSVGSVAQEVAPAAHDAASMDDQEVGR